LLTEVAAVKCKNHPDVEAVGRCAGCAEPFCESCMVDVQGKSYCADCKVMAIQSPPPVAAAVASTPCKEAGEALTYAIVGLFCFGIILEPIAISKALKAKKLLAADPNLTGGGKATAGLVIAIVGLVLWVLGLISRAASA